MRYLLFQAVDQDSPLSNEIIFRYANLKRPHLPFALVFEP